MKWTGTMPRPLFDDTLFIDVAFVLGLAVGVSASIHRIGEDMVECGVRGGDPADRTRHTSRRGLPSSKRPNHPAAPVHE